jgi:aminoglycoside phosphotransferase (APT) family kinase protein
VTSSTFDGDTVDVVSTSEAAARLPLEPLLILDPLEEFFDLHSLGSGPLSAAMIGAGHSNVTYLMQRGDERFVLRRPPRGPFPASAHDVVREARLLQALAPMPVRAPQVIVMSESSDVIGAPFYLMPYLDGHVLDDRIPEPFDSPGARRLIGDQVVDGLIELHTVDRDAPGLSDFGKPAGYLARQIRRFRGLFEANATRPLRHLEQVADWLERNLPVSAETTLVHGDYRLGNLMFQLDAPPRIRAILDWEMATLGDPLADLGYLTAAWAEPGDPPDPILDLSEMTRMPGFQSREQLADRYVAGTGRDADALSWYQVLAMWKSAIFLEGSYRRHRAGSTADPYFAGLEAGVPRLASRAFDQAYS